MPTPRDAQHTLVVPLDASGVADFKPERALKVAIVGDKGRVIASEKVQLDAKGQGEVRFPFPAPPGNVRVLVGPDDASDDEIVGLQTLGVTAPADLFREAVVTLPPIRITDFYWYHWLRWCRWYTIRGRLVCPDGSPVPGARVCAYDVDGWWWWSSQQIVGCATTDASGSFTLRFRWCCGWWPWWWWSLRDWRLDLDLAGRIRKLIEREPRLPVPPRPTVRPTLDVFTQLLGDQAPLPKLRTAALPALQPLQPRVLADPRALDPRPAQPLTPLDPTPALVPTGIDTSQLPALRERLVKVLPPAPELEQLQIWPWFPREPWFDCAPDIAFRATQDCGGEERVILSEPWWRARWNVDPVLDVTLVATNDACCIPPDNPVPGNCLVLSSVCNVNVGNIGGNVGAPPVPAALRGFADPGGADAPWGGVVRLEGQFGSGADVDYYRFEVAPTAAGPWTAVSPASAGGFSRQYYDDATMTFPYAGFPFAFIDGQYVVETRRHYETTHPGPWGVTRLWTGYNLDTLMNWLTAGQYDNGEHHLRLIGYRRVGDQLVDERIVPLCGTEDDTPPTANHVVVHLDNRTTGTPEDPSGDEPRAKVLDVRIGGLPAGPCSNIVAPAGADLDIDFVAYDVDEHLSHYTLQATFGADEPPINLLTVPGATLTGIAAGGAPAAAQVGPSYATALAQGAARPLWSGGGLRLHIPNIRDAFEQSCCYQIELWAYKRTIVDCNGNHPHRDFSFYSLTVTV
jgi:hypothetical protein